MPTPEAEPAKPISGLTNSVANVLGLLIPLAVFVVVTPTIIRGLGAAHFGVLTLFLTSLVLLTSFDFGLSAGGVRSLGAAFHAGGQNKLREIALEMWSAYFLLGLSSALILLIFRQTLWEILGLEAVLAAGVGSYALPLAVFFGFCSMACTAIFRAKESFVRLTAIQVFYGAASWLGVAVCARLGWGLDWALLWWAAMGAASFFTLAWWADRLTGGLIWLPHFRFVEIRRTLSYNLHAFLSQLAAGATYHADKLLISYFLGPVSVGYYGLASSLSTKLLSLVAAMAGFVFPRSVRMFVADDVVGLRATYVRATRYVLLISWPMLVVALLFGDAFLRLWVGVAFAEKMADVLLLLLVSYFLTSLSVVASQVFNGIGNSRVGAIFSSLGAAINLVACLIFIPKWGLLGAALASVLSMAQVFGYTRALHRRLDLGRFPFAGLWLRLLTIGLLQATLLWLTRSWVTGWWSLLTLGAVGWALFYVAWILLRFADEGDRNVAHRLWCVVWQRIKGFMYIFTRGRQ